MDKQEGTATTKDKPQEVPLKTFFEAIPPLQQVCIINDPDRFNATDVHFELPILKLFCPSKFCEGGDGRYFEPRSPKYLSVRKGPPNPTFVFFQCRNCQIEFKRYAIEATMSKNQDTLIIVKFGELWPFGAHTPARLITILGPDKDYFLKGRRAESQGMGMGAFAYYRRPVENQKNRILDQIIRVSKKVGAEYELLVDLEDAKKETQFTTAIERIKHGIPPALLIDGQHNPLTLLHRALSDGLHEQNDEACLTLATSIRTVLGDLAERLSQVLKDDRELTEAVRNLMKVRRGRTNP